MEWSNAWFILEEGLMEEEESANFLGNSPSSEENKENEFPEEISILPLKDNVLFPEIALPWVVTGEPWVRLINDAVLDKNPGSGFATRRSKGEKLSRKIL